MNGEVIRWDGEDCLIQVRVQPRASRERILGVQNGVVKVALTAPPVEGAANQALRILLAQALGVAKTRVIIAQGATGRDKLVRIVRPVGTEVALFLDRLPKLPHGDGGHSKASLIQS